jgi:hypothetical protein
MKEPIIAQFRLPITEKETVQELMQQGCNWGKTIGAIAELEKLKAEIKEEEEKGIYYECEEWIEGRPCDEDYFYGLKRAIMIIDKHISELKGEQKIEKVDCDKTDCNNCINHNYCDYEYPN